jgi:small subunit ribosomal protein S25e
MDKNIQERLNKEVLTYRLITTAVLVDRLKINGSLARQALADLEEKGVIKKIVNHSKLSIYSKFTLFWWAINKEELYLTFRRYSEGGGSSGINSN